MSLERKFACYLQGVPGAGKTTTNTLIHQIVTDAGGQCLNISFDKWIRKGVAIPLIAGEIHKEIVAFDKKKSPLKVAIIDLCNENGINPVVFNFDFKRAGYAPRTFTPNYFGRDFDEYQAWCLSNVLSRPLPSATDKFSLTPSTAGIRTCVDVHNRKTSSLCQTWHGHQPAPVANGTFNNVVRQIKIASDRYAQKLKSRSLERDVRQFMSFIY
jgi:hypothetical protein